MRGRKPWVQAAATVIVVVAYLLVQQFGRSKNGPPPPQPQPSPQQPAPRPPVVERPEPRQPASANRSNVGFRSRGSLEEHHRKHGREFGRVTVDEYLRMAQALRDAPAGGNILEFRRNDGVVTRFDRQTGDFLAFNRDYTIRTFFRPNDGEAYFHRQKDREGP